MSWIGYAHSPPPSIWGGPAWSESNISKNTRTWVPFTNAHDAHVIYAIFEFGPKRLFSNSLESNPNRPAFKFAVCNSVQFIQKITKQTKPLSQRTHLFHFHQSLACFLHLLQVLSDPPSSSPWFRSKFDYLFSVRFLFVRYRWYAKCYRILDILWSFYRINDWETMSFDFGYFFVRWTTRCMETLISLLFCLYIIWYWGIF